MSGKKRDLCEVLQRPCAKQLGTKTHKKTKFSDIDENASDGYEQYGRLVIQTEKDCFETRDSSVCLPINDTTEDWMKSKTEHDEQICQIDIGNDCYIVGKVFNGHVSQRRKRPWWVNCWTKCSAKLMYLNRWESCSSSLLFLTKDIWLLYLSISRRD